MADIFLESQMASRRAGYFLSSFLVTHDLNTKGDKNIPMVYINVHLFAHPSTLPEFGQVQPFDISILQQVNIYLEPGS